MKGYLFRASASTWPCSPLFPNTNSSWLHFCLHGTNPVKTNHAIFKSLKLKQPKLTSEKKQWIHYMVAHPDAFMKTCEVASPRRAQSNETFSSLGPLFFPNFFNSAAIKSEGVIPRTDWDLTDATKLAVRSSRVSASAICSLGLWTAAERQRTLSLLVRFLLAASVISKYCMISKVQNQ